MIKALKRLAGIALLSVAVIGMTGCDRVEVGYVGVKVDKLGSDKGVQEQVVGTGRYWTGINTEIYQFPTFNQMKTYDQPFIFQTKDSMKITAKVGVEYYVDRSKVAKVFQTYRKGVEEITEVNIRQNISDALIKEAGNMDIGTLAGSGKTTLLDNVTKQLKAKLDPLGIVIVKLSWTEDMVYPPQIIQSINAKIEATQKTQQRENEVAQTVAEAEKARAFARGEADSAKIRAQGEADALNLKGEALRKNPEVLQLEAIQKWDGKTPVYMAGGSNTPFITLPVPKQ